MATGTRTRVSKVELRLLELADRHEPCEQAVRLDVDIVTDPHSEDDEGFIYSMLSRARDARAVLPGETVVFGSRIGRWRGQVVAWDFEVSDEDPMILIEYGEAILAAP